VTAIYNPLDPEHCRDPYPRYHALRTEDPVHWSDLVQGWVLTRHKDVAGVLRDQRFSVDRGKTDLLRQSQLPPLREEHKALAESLKRVIIFLDPPDHTRIRRLISKAFTHKMIEKFRDSVQLMVDEFLDAAAAQGHVDWIKDFAYPLPVTVIANILGIPAEHHATFKRWSDDLGALLDPFISPPLFEKAMKSAAEMHAFFEEEFAKRRAEPRDDLISALVNVEEAGDKLSRQELFSTCVVLLGGGHLTTTNMLGNAVWALMEHPRERKQLGRDPGLIGPAVEEMIRYDCPLQATARVATEDCEIGGRKVSKGNPIILLLGAANRDPEQFENPDGLVFSRKENRHAAFGGGIHHCVGRNLARLEIQIAINTLLRRFPDFKVTCEEPERKPTVVARGFVALPLSLHG